VLTRVIKDTVPRYHVMKGQDVPRKAGWDTHGLPVELEVEKELGLDGKEQIEEYGMAEFIDRCKKSVWTYKGMWEDFSDTVGFWADMEHPYVTYHNDYIESEWWALKTIFDKGLLYKGYKIMPYCPRCGTPLSSHEVAQGYKDVKERSAIVRFRLKDEENASLLAWTTTPWTLPSNVALCVNPKETYARVKCGDEIFYLAEALLDAIPEPDPARANKHQPLPGDVPSPINPPLGSAFGHRIQHPSYPETVGADLTPVEIEPGHWVAPDPCSLEPEDWNKVRQR